ncbi:MAG: GNAT family N-acetyltransferase [Rhodoferax sp.]|uniref:GNAT family N-acetyltransferase n=1 Tax=Rhodoferax sp. TaxID=50421 RepID=UPI0013FF53C7|nr:GNAT family N-acetyltransferase [Rhodoferax sp.]NDP40452.1 GNAT family N-acetyltransferase [Rhodoferax sp.]
MLVLSLSQWHDRNGFDCGDAQLNGWFTQVAMQHKEKGVSSTFVVATNGDSAQVLGYYAISMAELVNTDLLAQHRKRLPTKVPVFRLGRLATDKGQQGKGIGAFMLFDAIDRVTRIASEVGGIGLVVNAKPPAVEFYKRYGFEQMADHPLNLFLSI